MLLHILCLSRYSYGVMKTVDMDQLLENKIWSCTKRDKNFFVTSKVFIENTRLDIKIRDYTIE